MAWTAAASSMAMTGRVSPIQNPKSKIVKLPFFLARRFVAAEDLDETLLVLRDLHGHGLHTTVDLLGEYISDRKLAIIARDAYIGLLHTLAEEHRQSDVDTNISIKLSMMGQKIDEDFCLDNLRQISHEVLFMFKRATSLGGTESLIEHRASVEAPPTRTPETLLRCSIGLEHVDDLLEDLSQALEA